MFGTSEIVTTPEYNAAAKSWSTHRRRCAYCCTDSMEHSGKCDKGLKLFNAMCALSPYPSLTICFFGRDGSRMGARYWPIDGWEIKEFEPAGSYNEYGDYRDARGAAPSLSGLSPEDAIRRIRS